MARNDGILNPHCENRATDWDKSEPKYEAARALFDDGTIVDPCTPPFAGSDFVYLSRALHARTFNALLEGLVAKGIGEVEFEHPDAAVLRLDGCGH